ncbi:hypothetical protein AXI59_16930 [Bacillus nakamurai]|uniref:hypothetical protein n=2 Tax=Bacillus nakamurai TaxID=1793963 RepID=UPI000778858C|nr:hypothetical protein [Bacillus nakamurai]KXZ18114.1 hypothetical protein AXI59_16930 [Bacillus nakamurai]
MKKIVLSAAAVVLVWILSIGDVSAKITKDEQKVSIQMTENETGFFMSDDTNLHYWPTKLGYRFTIYNAEGCTLNFKLQRITLAGFAFTLSEKNFTDNHLNLSAADQVKADANRNHFLEITKGAGCGDVWIKGFYGFEHDEPDEWQ